VHFGRYSVKFIQSSQLIFCRLFDGDDGEQSRTTVNIIQSKFYGSAVAPTLDDAVTHCICNSQ